MARKALMMTCPPRIRPKNGFTLLEIVIVLGITALIIAGAVTTVVATSSERLLRTTSADIELLARKTRTAAILHQTPYAIRFLPGRLTVSPISTPSEFERTAPLANEITGTNPNPSNQRSLNEELLIDPDIQLSVQFWNSTKFHSPGKSNTPTWRFDPQGLSEPIKIRLTLDDDYSLDTYHPLTASISDSELKAD